MILLWIFMVIRPCTATSPHDLAVEGVPTWVSSPGDTDSGLVVARKPFQSWVVKGMSHFVGAVVI